jgi:hypothetical protein
MRVYCTRPDHPDDDSRWNEIPDDVIRAGTVSAIDDQGDSQIHSQILIEKNVRLWNAINIR